MSPVQLKNSRQPDAGSTSAHELLHERAMIQARGPDFGGREPAPGHAELVGAVEARRVDERRAGDDRHLRILAFLSAMAIRFWGSHRALNTSQSATSASVG